MGEIIFHLFLVLVLSVFFNESFHISSARVADPIGPAGFPKAIIMILLLLVFISLYQAIKKMRSKQDEKKKEGRLPEELNITFIGILLSVFVFILIVDKLGFLLSAFLLVFVSFYLLGQRKILKILMISIITSFVFTLVFGHVLHVPLPRGLELFKELSYLIY